MFFAASDFRRRPDPARTGGVATQTKVSAASGLTACCAPGGTELAPAGDRGRIGPVCGVLS